MSRGELLASKWCRRTKDDRLRKERKEKKGRNLTKVDRYLQGKRGVPTTGKFRLVAGNTIRAEARYTQVSPFQALYGYNPRWIISITRTDLKVQGVKKRLENVRRMRALMAQSWEKATARQAANYNKKHNYRIFERG